VEGGGYVDSAEAVAGLTATAGSDVINVDSNADIGTGTNTVVVNDGNEGSILVYNAESMPGLTATAGAVTLAGIGVAAPVAASVINSYTMENEDDSQESIPTIEQYVYALRNTLDHINRQRRVHMSLLRDTTNVLRHRANVLDRFRDVVRVNFPDSLDVYRDIINSLRDISNRSASSNAERSNNFILDEAQEQGIDPAFVFEDIQEPLDILAERLERCIRDADPEAEFSSDTDSEKIAEAVEEHALRYPVRNNPSDSNIATGSGSACS